ncbi:MAG: D-alpha,beta-d-heptose 7-phosphate 1-kinase, d-beta-d-heptose 1-phosphate adenylyltransferase [Parcubacteria group bacterium]|nr:D-alpha,beta-d-heptose 7-phosphate 1-kinase, d-beta-d-heptose 1-phosphate adenylyltransferase [Parcubacteria group bacterium]
MSSKSAAKTIKRKPVTVKNILSSGSNLEDRLIPDMKELEGVVSDLKRMGYKIVLTQGVYDMLHEGHARYLEKALSYGDLLIVGVDSDELTSARKGPTRPIVPQSERLQMLAHLRSVSILTVRELEHGMEKLIRTVKPDVLITSASTKDFSKKEMMEYKNCCGEIVVLPPQAATSTTARVRLLTISGADQLAKEISAGVPQLVENALRKFRSQ